MSNDPMIQKLAVAFCLRAQYFKITIKHEGEPLCFNYC